MQASLLRFEQRRGCRSDTDVRFIVKLGEGSIESTRLGRIAVKFYLGELVQVVIACGGNLTTLWHLEKELNFLPRQAKDEAEVEDHCQTLRSEVRAVEPGIRLLYDETLVIITFEADPGD